MSTQWLHLAAAALPVAVVAVAWVRRRRGGWRTGLWLTALAAAGSASAYGILAQAPWRESIVAARGVIPGRAIVEGMTVRRTEGGRALVVYFRPLSTWSGKHVWVHAYPAGKHEYLDLPSPAPQSADWRQGELAREVFDLPPGAYVLYAGVTAHADLGPAHLLGSIEATQP
jgi:hypothetical protein